MTPTVNITQKTFKGMKMVENGLRNSCVFVGLILSAAVLFVVQVVFNTLAGSPDLVKNGPFDRSIGNISAQYPLNITPDGWAFSIWGIIYLLQLGAALYSLALLCQTVDGQPAYKSPAVLSPLYYILFGLSCIVNVGWLFQWEKLMFNSSLAFLASTALCLFSALSIVSTRLAFYKSDLLDGGRKCDVSVIWIIVNWLGMYATWTTIATLINLGVAMFYRWDLRLTNDAVSVICLGILSGMVIVYSVLDLTVFDRYLRYNLTPYATMIWALVAILTKNWNPSHTSSILSVILLGVSSVLVVLKIGFVIRGANKVVNHYRRLNVGGAANLKLSNQLKP